MTLPARYCGTIDATPLWLIGLGARRLEGPIEEWGESWIVLADPEGNELCVCTMGC